MSLKKNDITEIVDKIPCLFASEKKNIVNELFTEYKFHKCPLLIKKKIDNIYKSKLQLINMNNVRETKEMMISLHIKQMNEKEKNDFLLNITKEDKNKIITYLFKSNIVHQLKVKASTYHDKLMRDEEVINLIMIFFDINFIHGTLSILNSSWYKYINTQHNQVKFNYTLTFYYNIITYIKNETININIFKNIKQLIICDSLLYWSNWEKDIIIQIISKMNQVCYIYV